VTYGAEDQFYFSHKNNIDGTITDRDGFLSSKILVTMGTLSRGTRVISCLRMVTVKKRLKTGLIVSAHLFPRNNGDR